MRPIFIKSPGGYVALMATVVISLLLLIVVAEQGFAGSLLRFGVLGVEYKEQSASWAEGCTALAAAYIMSDEAYGAGSIAVVTKGREPQSCTIGSLERDTPLPGQVTVRVEAQAGGALTTLEVVIDQTSGSILSVQEI